MDRSTILEPDAIAALQEPEKTRYLIQRPIHWPHFPALPVRRRPVAATANESAWEKGVVVAASRERVLSKVYLVSHHDMLNGFQGQLPLRDLPQKEYASFEGMIEDGWSVY